MTVPAEILTSWDSVLVAVARMPPPLAVTLPTEILMSPFWLSAEMAVLAPVPLPDTFPVASMDSVPLPRCFAWIAEAPLTDAAVIVMSIPLDASSTCIPCVAPETAPEVVIDTDPPPEPRTRTPFS